MKKRILSLLLLVAMIVTALPLAVLSAIAAEEEKTYAAEDYNALYVQKDLIFAADFFRTNKYWGEAATTTLADYVWSKTDCAFVIATDTVENGYYNLNNATSNQYVKKTGSMTQNGNTGTTAEYLGVFRAGGMNAFAVNDVRANAKLVTRDGASFLDITEVGQRNSTDAELRTKDGNSLAFSIPVPATVGTVTVTQKTPDYSKQYYYSYIYNATGAVKPTEAQWNASSWGKISTLDTATGQNYIFPTHEYDEETGGVKALAQAEGRYMFAFYKPVYVTTDKVWDAAANDGAGAYVTDPAGEKLYIVGVEARDENAKMDFTDNMGEPKTEGGYAAFYNSTPGHYGIAVDGVSYFSSDEVYYPANGNILGDTYLRLYAKLNHQLYAFRQYSRILSADEYAQNRFADLAKWFRIDLGYIGLLNADSLAELYAFAADLTFEDETAGDAIEQKAKALAEAQYSSLDADIVALAGRYGLDLSPLAAYPKGVLPATYSFLLSGIAASEDVAADYAAAVDADLLAYFATGKMTQTEYNSLYVQDGLVYSLDFFAANKFWSPNGVAADLGEDYLLTIGYTQDEMLDYTVTGSDGSSLSFDKKADADAKQAELAAANPSVTYTVNAAQVSDFATKRSALDTAARSWMALWASSSSTALAATFNTPPATRDPNGVYQIAPFTLEDGYVSFKTRDSEDYLNFTGFPYQEAPFLASPLVSDNMSQQVVGVHKSATITSASEMLMFGNVRLKVTQEGSLITFYKIDQNFTPTDYPTTKPTLLVDGKSTTLTFTIEDFKSNMTKLGTGKATLRNGIDEILSVNGSYAAKGYNTFGIGYGKSTMMDLYAYRYYIDELTNEEIMQNHFADLAKFFRLNLSGFETLGDAEKKAVYAAVADFDLTSDRLAVQNAVSAVLTPFAREAYEAMKGEDAAINAFLDLAADYLLDVTPVLSAKRDMSSLLETVTAEALAGKTVAEAQAILDEAYFDAYYYLSYAIPGEDAFNAFLTALAASEAHLNIEHLMALPKADRLAGAALGLDQAAIDAYVAEKMTAYAPKGDYDYDSLYVKDGLVSQYDFFKLNSYWSEDEDPVLPTAPVDAIGDGAIFKTDGKWAVVKWTSAKKDAYRPVTDAAGTVKDAAPYLYENTAEKTAKEQAEARAAELNAANSTNLYEAIPDPGSNSETLTAEYVALIEQYKKDINAQLDGFRVFGDPYFILALSSVSYKSYHDQTGRLQKAPFVYGDGYLQMQHNQSNNFVLLKPAFAAAGILSSEYILTSGDIRTGNSANFLNTSDVTVKISGVDANGFSFTGYNKYGGIFESSTTGVLFETQHRVNVSNTTPFSLITESDRSAADGTVTASLYFNGGHVGETMTSVDSNPTTTVTQFGYSSSSPAINNRIYAIRFYTRALTAADYAQNHFADLAKFYRLDVSLYDLLNDTLRAELYAAVADFALGVSNRDEIVAAMNAVFAKHYEGIEIYEDEAKNDKFLSLAAFATLDLAPIKNLSAAARAAITDPIIAEFDVNYAVNAAVVAAVYEKATYSLGAMTFAGYQVRIDTGAASQNYAGVRAVFDVNEEIVKTLAADDTVTLTVAISLDGAVGSTIEITYDAETDALKGVMTTGDVAEDVIFYERDGKTSFNYTVVYKKAAPTAEQLATEYAYAYTIKAGETAIDFAVKSETFGETVSAFELYDYFAGLEEYATDRVVADVLSKRP